MTTEPTLEQLLRHMELYYSDRHINKAMDAIYQSCPNDDARAACRAYARARRSALGFDPSRYRRNSEQLQNNHNAISEEVLRNIREPRGASRPGPTCGQCGAAFDARRKDARFCGPACRKRASRASGVTDQGPKLGSGAHQSRLG